MMRRPAAIVLWMLLACSVSYSQVSSTGGSTAANTQQDSEIHYVRSISGSKGAPDGSRFVMEEPRTVFYIPANQQVIVYMEWDGPPGKHHIEGFWKNPDGKVSALSDFDYDAKERRFGGFWTLAISESAQVGTWMLEAHVDGQVAGTHSFQILSGTLPPDAAPARRPLRAAELYQQAVNSSVTVEKLDSRGEKGAQAPGFLLQPGWIVTAFEAIDGASKVRITLPDGRKIETSQVTAWDRWKNWAIIRTDTSGLSLLRTAPANSWNVGDQVSALVLNSAGERVIGNVIINGKNDSAKAGSRLNLDTGVGTGGIGSPLLNDYGEVIGIVVSNAIPGASPLQMVRLPTQTLTGDVVPSARVGSAVSVSVLPDSVDGSRTASFDQLMAQGEFIAPIPLNDNFSYGQLAHGVVKQGGAYFPVRTSQTFSKREPRLAIFLMWAAQTRRTGLLSLRVYDLDNRLLYKSAEKQALKLNLKPGDNSTSTWEFSVASLMPAVYRLETWLDDAPVWRAFFRVTE